MVVQGAQQGACNQSAAQVRQQRPPQQLLRTVLTDELLKAGADPQQLQAVLAGCAAALLKVSQLLVAANPAQQQQLLQDGLSTMEEVAGMLQHREWDEQVLRLVHDCVNLSGACSRSNSSSGHSLSLTQRDATGSCWGEWVASCPLAAQLVSASAGMLQLG